MSKEKETAIEFLNWCNTPVYRAKGNLGFWLRAAPMFPEYDRYLVIDETGCYVLLKGAYLSAEELYEFWETNYRLLNAFEAAKRYWHEVFNVEGPFIPDLYRRNEAGTIVDRLTTKWTKIAQPLKIEENQKR